MSKPLIIVQIKEQCLLYTLFKTFVYAQNALKSGLEILYIYKCVKQYV